MLFTTVSVSPETNETLSAVITISEAPPSTSEERRSAPVSEDFTSLRISFAPGISFPAVSVFLMCTSEGASTIVTEFVFESTLLSSGPGTLWSALLTVPFSTINSMLSVTVYLSGAIFSSRM